MIYFDFTLSATPPPKSGVKGQASHQVNGLAMCWNVWLKCKMRWKAEISTSYQCYKKLFKIIQICIGLCTIDGKRNQYLFCFALLNLYLVYPLTTAGLRCLPSVVGINDASLLPTL